MSLQISTGSLVTFLILSTLSVPSSGQECAVTVKNGVILGSTGVTMNPSKKVCAYTSIPYASPPVGSLRFKNPIPAQSWGSLPLNATSSPNWCPQMAIPPSGIKMIEDCLYLNVYSPKGSTSASNLPVMVWIHGGSFTGGSSQFYTPIRLLARADVVLVVIHYRLGILGFLSTGDSAAPGNYGLKDQALSLKWVNQNIAAFGGNPQQVTVFGESAGGASTAYQLITPLNKGIIHRVIAQSGSAMGTWSLDRNPIQNAKSIAAKLGCPLDSSAKIVSCLQIAKWENIVIAQGAVSPVVEPNLPGAFITKEPMEIMKTGDIPNIPVIIGANKHDGSFLLLGAYQAVFGPLMLDKNPDYMRNQIVPDILKFFGVMEDPPNRAVASTFESEYLGGVNRSLWNESMPGLVDIYSVLAFKSSAQHTADLLSKRGLNVYLYSFEHHSNNTLFFNANGMPIKGGIAHADDLLYLFHSMQFNTADQTFSDLFCDMWLNFSKFGNPTPSASSRYEKWLEYNTGDEPYMKLNVTPKILHGYRNSWRPNGFQWN